MKVIKDQIIIIQFLLRQAFADDEASTRLLRILLFLLLSTASLMFIPCAIRSSFTLSIRFFGCLPLLLVPSTCPYSTTTGSLFPSILLSDTNQIGIGKRTQKPQCVKRADRRVPWVAQYAWLLGLTPSTTME